MASITDQVQSTLALINAAKLPHPQGPLLASFILEALNPAVAAQYVSDRFDAGNVSDVVADWRYIVESITIDGCPPPRPDARAVQDIIRRDGGRCCVTGKKGSFWDPLQVSPVLPVPFGWIADRIHISQMLGAFFGPPYRNWWFSYARAPDQTRPCQNHWLIQKSAAEAFAQGFVKLERMQPSMVEYEVKEVLSGPEKPLEVDGAYTLLGDHSRSNVEKVDPRFIGTHARLAKSIRFLEIAKEIQLQQMLSKTKAPVLDSQRKGFPLSGHLTGALLRVWIMFPTNLRVLAYELLRKAGERLYGKPNDYSTVQRLPLGLYLKYQGEPEGFRNEFNALQTVRRHTIIPVPRPLDLVTKKGDADDPFSSPESYLLITRLPGIPLSRCQHILSDDDYEGIATQLKDYVTQLRSIRNEVNAVSPICNTLGEAIRDPRIHSGDPVGPFADEAAFSQHLRFSDEPSRRGHKVVFTHADLNPRNILVDRARLSNGQDIWRVSGIVDWENSGYYPEYWDYTKAMFEGFRWTFRHNEMVKGVFTELGDYSAEFEVEKRSWESGDGI